MKKILCLITLLGVMIISCGCESYISAIYDDFNETFQGNAYYDPSVGRAVVTLKSDVNETICTGSTPFYHGIPVYNFNILCSDGRMITGVLPVGLTSGKAFTNRNEILTYKITKTKKSAQDDINAYKQIAVTKPILDNSKEHIQVIMQPNKF